MSLSKRLSEIYALVDKNSNLADIGADHGQLVIELAKNKRCQRIFCNDNKSGPFKILKSAIEKFHFDNVDVSLSDGLNELPSYVDSIVIAGLGGDLMIQILQQGKEKLSNIETLILAPNTKEKEVRISVCNMGYQIIEEKIVFEKKHYYEILKFSKGHKDYDELDYEFGPILRKEKNQTFQDKYSELEKKLTMIFLNAPESKKRDILKKIERIRSL